MAAACALAIFRGIIIYFRIAERLRTLRYPISWGQGRNRKRQLRPAHKNTKVKLICGLSGFFFYRDTHLDKTTKK